MILVLSGIDISIVEEQREAVSADMSIWVFDSMPSVCRPVQRDRDSIHCHCLVVMAISTRGYSMDFFNSILDVDTGITLSNLP